MSLEVVIGPMFSGKTSYAIEVAALYISKNMRVLIVKPTRDTRSIPNHITTHDGISLPCFETSTLNGLTEQFMANYETIIIDEAQFFQGLVPFVEYAVDTLGK
jgi:thymidine kinase